MSNDVNISDEEHGRTANFQPETFEPLVGSVFLTNSTGKERSITLIQVSRCLQLEALEGSFEHRPRHPFSLLFGGDEAEPLSNGLYRMRHPELGEFVLSLGPILKPHDAPANVHYTFFYEAVFA